MLEHHLKFCFKGSRTYVHGTDIYTKMLEYIINHEDRCHKLDLAFHGVAKKNLLVLDTRPEEDELLKFSYKYTDTNGNRKTLYGVESESELDCRYEYPEEEIYAMSVLDVEKKEILLEDESLYLFIENIVALNKHLLETLFSGEKGKWYFTRLQLNEIPKEEFLPIRVVFKSNFNFKLIKSEIFIDEKSAGFIYFSLV